MNKKLPFTLFFALFVAVSFGQTIVSTSPEDKNVVLEEFTGIYCVYCPDGHARAAAIQDANPDRVSLINIHEGSYANPNGDDPDFRTPYGTAIAGQSDLTGYPSGTVNRHVFPGRSNTAGGTAMYRNFWAISADEILDVGSNVNVGVEASIDINTRILTVHVEAFYTADSPEPTNLLNVALLQNNTAGPQIGGNAGNNYIHMHRLVEMITGQWGENINTTTTNTFVDRTFTYTIPADYNGVEAKLVDMEVVAFISNTHQEIPSGSRAYPDYEGLAIDNDVNVISISELPEVTCETDIEPTVTIENLGNENKTSLAITYKINNESHTYNWTGNLLSLQSETIELPEVTYTPQAINTVEVSVPGDDDNANNSATADFDQAPAGTGTVTMALNVDNKGSDIRWYVYNSEGAIVYNGGPYDDNNPQTITETFQLPADCYQFRIRDISSNGGGSITLTDNTGTELYSTDGNYGAGERSPFSSNGVLGVTQLQLDNISLYPNPASTILNLKGAESANIQVFDVIGKMIFSQENISMDAQMNVEKLQSGTYFIKISKDNLVTTKRFLISR